MPKKSKDNIFTPVKKKTERDLSLSEGSRSNSTDTNTQSDQYVTTATNKILFISVEKEKTTKTGHNIILLKMSDARPKTELGKKQGDHVTAYKAFLEMIITSTHGYRLKKIPELILNIAKAVMPEHTEYFDTVSININTVINSVATSEQRKKAIKVLKDQNMDGELIKRIQNGLILSNQYIYMNNIKIVAESFIEKINLSENIAFTKTMPDSQEGARVKKATHALRVVNELKYHIDSINKHPKHKKYESRLNSFFKTYLAKGSLYKDGANALFGKDNLTTIEKEWKNKSFKDKKQLLKELCSSIKYETLSSFMGDLFDFKYRAHKKIDPENFKILYNVVAKHLVIMFNAFDRLQSFDKNQVIDLFLKNIILEKQGWKTYNKNNFVITKDILINGIKNYADLNNMKMLSIEKEIVTTTSITKTSFINKVRQKDQKRGEQGK